MLVHSKFNQFTNRVNKANHTSMSKTFAIEQGANTADSSATKHISGAQSQGPVTPNGKLAIAKPATQFTLSHAK